METILITGGSGFLGRNLGKRLHELGHTVFLASRNNKQNFQASTFSGCPSLAMDVTNIESVRDIITQTSPTIVVHAAATKFVDVSELQPMETIDTNVLGSQNVARVAIDKGVRAVIGVSTDKAAPPVRNTYGLSKALMERLLCSMNGKSDTKFMCVRYGNVAWSTASVLTIWQKHLDSMGVIETTGPDMTRFFFTVSEAVNLVITAIDRIDDFHGGLLSREMKSAKMQDIIEVWCRHRNAEWRQIKGRPGERNYEILVGELELPYSNRIEINGIDHFLINFNKLSLSPLNQVLSSANACRLDKDEILAIVSNPPPDET